MSSSQSQLSQSNNSSEPMGQVDGDTVMEVNDQKSKKLQRAQWLRAAILGASDGLISTTSLMLGIGAASEDGRSMILSGLAGAVAGACSMAIGEYVSVSTQRDIQQAAAAASGSRCVSETDIEVNDPSLGTPASKGSARAPAMKMSREMKSCEASFVGSSAIWSPAVKELDVNEASSGGLLLEGEEEEIPLTNPYQAAAASALAFLCGSFVPLVSAILVDQGITKIVVIAVTTSLALAFFGAFGAHLGGSPVRKSAARVLVGGWIAMAITYGLLKAFESYHEI